MKANLVKLTEGGGIDEVRIVLDALFHEVIGFLAVVVELARDLRVAVGPVILKCLFEEPSLD